MIYPGHSKFYKKDGFKIVQKFINNQACGVMYGKYKECNVYLIYRDTRCIGEKSEGIFKNSIKINISISIFEDNEQQVKEAINEIKSHIYIDSVKVDEEGCLDVSIKNNKKSLKYKSVKECTQFICNIFHQYKIYNDGCEKCKKNSKVKSVLIQGFPNILCDTCLASIKEDAEVINTAYENIPNNYLKGLLGGVIGGGVSGFIAVGMLFILHKILISTYAIWELGIILFILLIGSKIGYRKIGGKVTLKGRCVILLSKVLSWGIVFVVVVLADYFTKNPKAIFDMDTILKVLIDPLYKTEFVGGLFLIIGICLFFLEGMILIIDFKSIPKGQRNDNLIKINIEE